MYSGSYQDIAVDQEGKEDKVMYKRSIFRLLKKALSKIQKNPPKLKKNLTLLQSLQRDPEYSLQYIADLEHMSKVCMCYDHYLAKGKQQYGLSEEELLSTIVSFKKGTQTYVPLIGDPCYRYKRISKETFFRDFRCRRAFIHAYSYLRSKCHCSQEREALEELVEYAVEMEEDRERAEKIKNNQW